MERPSKVETEVQVAFLSLLRVLLTGEVNGTGAEVGFIDG
jgi:hypothetical protein